MIKLEMTKKQETILAAIILIIAVGVFVSYTGILRSPKHVADTDVPPPEPSFIEIINRYVEEHDDADKRFSKILEDESSQYSLKNPFVKRDPYGASPLTALLIFKTEEPMSITISVVGKTTDARIHRSFPDFETNHIIPIYGLYPQTTNIIEITAVAQSGDVAPQSTTLTIETNSISDDIPAAPLAQSVNTTISSGNPELYFTVSPAAAFDNNGDYRWIYTGIEADYPVIYTDYGTMLLVAASENDEENPILLEINMLGRIENIISIDEYYEFPDYSRYSVFMRTLYP